MTVELVASRLIARYLGSSLYTWTGVMGVILAGMSLGNYLGGRMADSAKNLPGRLAAGVEPKAAPGDDDDPGDRERNDEAGASGFAAARLIGHRGSRRGGVVAAGHVD